MSSIETGAFDPFFHEIVTIEQADDPHRPIEITGTRRPGLMLGEFMFSRGGRGARWSSPRGGRDRRSVHALRGVPAPPQAHHRRIAGMGTQLAIEDRLPPRLPHRPRLPLQRRRHGRHRRRPGPRTGRHDPNRPEQPAAIPLVGTAAREPRSRNDPVPALVRHCAARSSDATRLARANQDNGMLPSRLKGFATGLSATICPRATNFCIRPLIAPASPRLDSCHEPNSTWRGRE